VTPNPDDGRGLIAHWLDRVFGVHWGQKVASLYGYGQLLIVIIGTSGGLWNDQIRQLGFPWLANNWMRIFMTCQLLQAVTLAIKARAVQANGSISK
jgi:hypothetical protein